MVVLENEVLLIAVESCYKRARAVILKLHRRHCLYLSFCCLAPFGFSGILGLVG